MANKRIGIFSYGSGMCSTMQSACFQDDDDKLKHLVNSASQLAETLQRRKPIPAQDYTKWMKKREEAFQKGIFTNMYDVSQRRYKAEPQQYFATWRSENG